MSSKKSLELLKTISKFISETDGFDKVVRNMSIIDGGKGFMKAEMKVEKEHLNGGGGLHGGLSSTIVDCATTYALMTYDDENIRAGVSVDLHIKFLKGARENDELIIDARTIKCGKTLAFLECEIRNKKCNSVLVKGAHTKYVGSNSFK